MRRSSEKEGAEQHNRYRGITSETRDVRRYTPLKKKKRKAGNRKLSILIEQRGYNLRPVLLPHKSGVIAYAGMAPERMRVLTIFNTVLPLLEIHVVLAMHFTRRLLIRQLPLAIFIATSIYQF